MFIFQTGFSQDAVFDWAKQLDRRSGTNEAYFVGVDNNKNVYVAGGFTWEIDVDPGPGTYNIPGTQFDQIFLVKLTPLGQFMWAKKIGGTRFTHVKDLHIDPDGDITITGTFSGTTDFDPGQAVFDRTAIYTAGPENYDMFTVKLNNDGNFKWATTAGALNPDGGISVATDKWGNTYTAGSFTNEVDFNPGGVPALLNNGGTWTTFITKHNMQGNLVWAKSFATPTYSYPVCLRTDQFSNIYISGYFEDLTDFDPGPAVHRLSSLQSGSHNYITKLDGDGNFIWAKNQGGSWFSVTDNQQLFLMTMSVGFQAQLEKYDMDGTMLWSKLMGGRPSRWPAGNGPIAIDKGNNIYLTGEFNYTKDFDPSAAAYNMTCFSGGYEFDAFFCRFDVEGNFVWAKQVGGYSEEHPTSIALDTAGGIYTTGIFNNRVDFDPGPGVFEMQTYPGGGIYIHKLQNCQQVTYSTLNINTCTAYTLNNQTYRQSGTYRQTFVNAAGCDSILTLHLVIQNTVNNLPVTSCDSYTWNGIPITTSGTYTHTYISVAGCDSIVNLNLTINRSKTSTINKKICEGMQYDGYTQPGTYTDRFLAANGCDSIRTLLLEVTPKKYTTINASICDGKLYEGYSTSGTYTDVFVSSTGCDSTRVLQLRVNPSYDFLVSKDICAGQNYLGHTTSGTYKDYFKTVAGCDSVQTTRLRVLDKPTISLGKDTVICLQDSLLLRPGGIGSFTWQDGSTKDYYIVRVPGIYKVDVSNTCGSTSASINIGESPCTIYFPSAFTPNNDGKNDRFGILNGRLVSDYLLRIFDRNGMIVFESKNPSLTWDGKYKGNLLATGVFVWTCSFKENGLAKFHKGTTALMR